VLPVLVVCQVFVAAGILLITLRNIVKSKHIPIYKNYTDKELPTVTVAIPARNETRELEDCLRSIIANNYPKFEVVVLDDCSHDRTPQIIKQFAQDGVRFVKGEEPKERWLAKNQAYDKLADEASGEIILFCGTDVRFGPETIRSLITTMLSRNKDMISILPRRMSSDFFAAFIQPMRYWWELALPRRYFNRPSVLSTCWAIRRKTLKKHGGFDAVQHAVIPEGFFARELVKSDEYSFIRADDELDVQTRKTLPRQRETTIRMRYPQLRRRLELVMLFTIGEILFLALPFTIALSTFWTGVGYVQSTAFLACGLLILTQIAIVQVSNPANVLLAAFNLPLVISTEIYLGLASMLKYEFSTVDWKGRNVCVPVMHAYPK
ncbi:MAG: glycosyltransferase family 2 protein, partial [Acidobacteriota bacterium]